MKRIFIFLTGISMALTSLAQTDSTTQRSDTVRIGNMVIIKKAGKDENGKSSSDVTIHRREYKPSNVSTNWFILDLGFTNYNDQTAYGTGAAQAFAPGLVKDDFKLRTGKSVNVNIWIVMQRLNMISHVVNLKYGLGLELNNYRYKRPLLFETDPTLVVIDGTRNYEKNKLAADYITVPMMLNFNFTPGRRKGFGFSAGVSAGYLYSSRQKTITSEDGKQKERNDFDLRPWKLSYIGELSLGPIKLYGSMASQSIFEKGLDQTPYNIGFRLSNW